MSEKAQGPEQKRKGSAHYTIDQWPTGKRQRLTYQLATKFFDTLSTSSDSLFRILWNNPDFPPYGDLMRWKRKFPWFAESWKNARDAQAEFLIQKTLDIAKTATVKTAHLARVQFDVYRYIAGKFSPAVYGEKSASTSTAVNVNVAIVPTEKLTELRARLEQTREHFRTPSKTSDNDRNRVTTLNNVSDQREPETPAQTGTETQARNGNE